MILQSVLVSVQLHFSSDKSIEGKLGLIDEVCGDSVDIGVDLEWWFRFKVGWRNRVLGRLLGRLWRVQVLVAWLTPSEVGVIGRLLSRGRSPRVRLLGELPRETWRGTWQVGVLRGTIRILKRLLLGDGCGLLRWKESLSIAVHHCSLKTLFRWRIVSNDWLHETHHFSEIWFLWRSLLSCPATEVRHLDFILSLQIWFRLQYLGGKSHIKEDSWRMMRETLRNNDLDWEL